MILLKKHRLLYRSTGTVEGCEKGKEIDDMKQHIPNNGKIVTTWRNELKMKRENSETKRETVQVRNQQQRN
jgi:hypothetical protein